MSKCYILIWLGTTGKVLSNGIMFDIDVKPSLGFQFSQLYYDTCQQVHESHLLTGNSTGASGEDSVTGLPVLQMSLTPSQIETCQKYCDTFVDTQDYIVQTYDSMYIFAGAMLKSEASKVNLRYTIADIPTTLFSKWSEIDKEWAPIYVVFKEDGFPVFEQEAPKDDDILMMTEKEFKELPPQPNASHSLNFVSMTWEDKRDIEKVRFDAIMDIRVYFEHREARTGSGRVIPSEQSSYEIQYREALAYLEDKDAPTPFLDGFMSMNKQLIKKELCESIVSDYSNEALFARGVSHGEMYHYIYQVKAATTVEEIDGVVMKVYETIGKHRILNVYRQYPPDFNKQVATGTNLAIFTGGTIYHSTSGGTHGG